MQTPAITNEARKIATELAIDEAAAAIAAGGAVPLAEPQWDVETDRVIAERFARVLRIRREMSEKRNLAAFRTERPLAYDPGTAETRRKLKHDVVHRMYRRGQLRPEHLDAAEEIRSIVEAVTVALMPSGSDFAMRSVRGGRFADPIDRLPGRVERAWRCNYRPWTIDMQQWPIEVHRAGKLLIYTDPLPPVFAIVVDNWPTRAVEEAHRMRHGVAHLVVREALHRYAQISGAVGGETARIVRQRALIEATRRPRAKMGRS